MATCRTQQFGWVTDRLMASELATLALPQGQPANLTLDVDLPPGLRASGRPPWKSNGGPKGHPDRGLPFSWTVSTAQKDSTLAKVRLMGVFADHATTHSRQPAASVVVTDSESMARIDLLSGTHFDDAKNLKSVRRLPGDGCVIETVGTCKLNDSSYRVDLITLECRVRNAKELTFRDLGTEASFIIFDAFAEYKPHGVCPFHSNADGVSLRELGAVLRVGDRVRFASALAKLADSLQSAIDLDEARSQALTFLAVVTAAMLESGGGRELHMLQLDVARRLDKVHSVGEVRDVLNTALVAVAPAMFATPLNPSAALIDRALAYVDRNFAHTISDETLACQLGLSTSHFRHLFREATGQPFHRYVVSVRLERARRMLVEGDAPVSKIAAVVGFVSMSHFSRAFFNRFAASPTQMRRHKV